jgi:hypothetical protein
MSDASKYALIQQVKDGRFPVQVHVPTATAVFTESHQQTIQERIDSKIERLLDLWIKRLEEQ